MLRFDVETIYKATPCSKSKQALRLRFDVETIYKATLSCAAPLSVCCGLM